MIDTLVLTGLLNAETFGGGLGLETRWQRSAGGGMVQAVSYGPGPWRMTVNEEGVADLRLSIPRLVNSSGINYPLVPLSAWDRLQTAREVVTWVGIDEARRERAAEALAERWLTSWGVRTVAFAVDAYSANIPDVLRSLSNRKQRSPSQTWGGLQPEGIQWHSTRRRVQIYDKARQIPKLLRSRDYGEVTRELGKLLARHAQNHLRFEVTLRGAAQVRRLAGLRGGLLPTLEWVGRPDVGAYVLTKEAKALGLSPSATEAQPDPWQGCQEPSGAPAMGRMAAKVGARCQVGARCIDDRPSINVQPRASLSELARQIALLSSAMPGGRSKRSAATSSRILSAAAFAVVSQHMSREQLQRELRMTDSVYYDQRRFIEGLGFKILGGDGLEDHRRLASFAEELFLELGDPVDSPPAPPRPEASTERPAQVVLAPWAQEVVFEGGQVDKRTPSDRGHETA